MSLIRQIALLLGASLLLAFAGSVAINIHSTREVLQTQLRLKNSDNASALALALSQQKGQRDVMTLLLEAQFDTGFYRRIRLRSVDGERLFERESGPVEVDAPKWFVALTPIVSEPGVAQVSNGWHALGSVEVESHSAFVHDELWRGSQRAVAWLALLGLVAGAFAAWFVARLRAPLDRTVEQARALEHGDYVLITEPGVPELRRVTRAMNSMVTRLRQVFEAQAAQVEALRSQANRDALTGLANRPHFMGRLASVLESEDGAAACGLVLLRVVGLAEMNRTLGRAATDRLLRAIAQTLQTYAQHVPGCAIGRINGADFALCLPVGGVAFETAHAVIELLRAALPSFASTAAVVAGVAEAERGTPLTALMSSADLALASAEIHGPFAVDAGNGIAAVLAARGEGAWREQIQSALEAGRARLGRFALVDSLQRVVHFECPLRLQLDPGGDFEVAAVWLPLAQRARLLPAADEQAVARVLAEIALDGLPRCVNVSAASLAEGGFLARLRRRLQDAAGAAAALWIEVPEAAAADQFELVRELGRQLRPLGVRLGLEHAGERLGRNERLFELGLDYVKLDAAVATHVAGDADRIAYARSLIAMLHGLALQVYAEGVANADDAEALWACGIDGITGPFVTATGST